MSALDELLAGLPDDRRAALEHVRAVVAATAPEAVEGKSYGVPAFLLDGRPLLGLQSARQHLSLYPFSPPALATVADVVPLIGENRSLVKRGLAEMRRTKRVGLRALMEASKCEPGRLDGHCGEAA